MTSSSILVSDLYGNEVRNPKNLASNLKLDRQITKLCFVRSSTSVSEIDQKVIQTFLIITKTTTAIRMFTILPVSSMSLPANCVLLSSMISCIKVFSRYV